MQESMLHVKRGATDKAMALRESIDDRLQGKLVLLSL
jgi:hypothetical protein